MGRCPRALWALCLALLLLASLSGDVSGEALSHMDELRAFSRQPNKFKERKAHKDEAGGGGAPRRGPI